YCSVLNRSISRPQLLFRPLGHTISAPAILPLSISAAIASINCLLLPSPCSSNNAARSLPRKNCVPSSWCVSARSFLSPPLIPRLPQEHVRNLDSPDMRRTEKANIIQNTIEDSSA